MSESSQKTEKRVHALIRDAVATVMETTDIAEITVGDVVRVAQISRSTFYRYFSCIDDVVKEIETEMLEGLKQINEWAMIDPNYSSVGESFQNNLARTNELKKHAKYIKVITGPHGDPQYAHKAIKVIREYLIKRYGFSKEKNQDFLAEFVASGYYHIINYWLACRPDIDSNEFTRIQYETFRDFNRIYDFH